MKPALLTLALMAAPLAAPAAAQTYLCQRGPLCSDGECFPPPRPDDFKLVLDAQGAVIVNPDDDEEMRLEPLAPEGLRGMRAYAAADAGELAVMALRDDGALSIAVMAARMFSDVNRSVLATARCEEME